MIASPRRGSFLLLCLALVALASMLVFSFAMSMRQLKTAGGIAVAGELARSAARMAVRHVHEVAAAAVAQDRLGTAEWPLLCSFGHLDRDDPANRAPDGGALDPVSWLPNPFDGGDNVPADDKLFAMLHGCSDDARGYVPTTWWPWPVTDGSGSSTWDLRKGAILNPSVPRWIEPGAWSDDMFANPVRFTAATAPVRGTRPVEPSWYDGQWGAVDDPKRIRYRLRYAVAAYDLGGHLTWGRQLGFIANRVLDADYASEVPLAAGVATTRFHLAPADDARDRAAGRAFAAPLRKTPHEWDETTARSYLVSLQAMLGKQGVGEGYLAGAPDWRNQGSGYDARPLASSLFLGRGSAKVRVDFENEYESPWTANLLTGLFSTGGGSRPITYPPGRIGAPAADPPLGLFSFQMFARGNGGSLAAICQGGPPSWQAAENVGRTGLAGDYWALWSATPFGRANEFAPEAFTPAALAAAKPAYWQGRTDNPWRINLLTAPADTIRTMLYGYLPQMALKEPLVSIGGSQTATWWTNGGPAVVQRPGLNTDPSPDPTSTAFNPRSLRTFYRQALVDSGRSDGAGEVRLFHPFSFPDRSTTPTTPSYTDRTATPTSYEAAYPGPKEEWEDYARLEIHPWLNTAYVKPGAAAGDAPRLGSDGSFDYGHLYKCMLGARITAFNDPDWPAPATAYVPAGNAGAGSWSTIAASNAWKPDAAHPETRPSILYAGLWLPADHGGSTWYNARPFEPMRGSGAFLCQKLLGRDPNGNHEVRYDPNWYIQNTANNYSGIPFNIRNNRPYFFRDSYWLDLMYATAAALGTAKALYQDAAHVGPAARTTVRTGTANYPAGWRPIHIRDVDALFLAYLGEWHPATPQPAGRTAGRPGDGTTPPTFLVAKSLTGTDLYGNEAIRAPRVLLDYQAKWNIASLHRGDATGGGFLSAPEPAVVGGALEDTTDAHGVGLDKELAWRKSVNMERVLNDWRMSFFGANPDYADFAPLDFNGDGYAVCSAYGACALTAAAKAGVTVPDPAAPPPATVSKDLPARAWPSRPASAGVGPPPDLWFSLTGFFVFDKVRFIRAIVRGQVWDEVRRVPVASADLDAVLAVDPDGDVGSAGGSGLRDGAVLYQRWLRNNYTGNQAHSPE